MNLNIVYEDPNFLVINKPAGISVHKTHPQDPHETIADILVREYPEVLGVGENPLRPGIVHRLDKDTSGLMIVAKNQDTFLYFKNLFQSRKMKKYYLALVHGAPKTLTGTITATLGKLGTKQTTQLKGKKELVERDAITNYETLQKFEHYTLLGVSPQTGRTHQIRVHLKSIGCPIVGDTLYGPRNYRKPAELTRLFLHAQRLEFVTPEGKSLTIEADLPEDLQKTLSGLQ